MALVLVSVTIAGALAPGAAGAGPGRAGQSDQPVLVASPASGIDVGDTITVSGTGLSTDPALSGFVWVHGCRSGIEIGDSAEEIQDLCSREFNSRQLEADGSISLPLRVTAPGWDAVVAIRQTFHPEVSVVVEAVAPISVARPEVPTVALTSVAQDVIEPDHLAVEGWAYPAPPWGDAVLVRGCSIAVLEDPTDQAVVDAACDFQYNSDIAYSGDGSFITSDSFVARDEWDVIWAGARIDGALVAATAPVRVTPPRAPLQVTAEPATQLENGDTIEVTATGFHDVGGEGYGVYQCEAAALDELVERWPTMSHCGSLALFGAAKDGDTFTGEVTVSTEFTIDEFPYDRTVRCDTGPGACALVVASWTTETWVAGGTPISFARPALIPLAAQVAEGDTGAVTGHVPVVLSRSATGEITVGYRTLERLGPVPVATPGRDYTATTGTLTFAPGQTRAAIPIEILGDFHREPTEVVAIQLSEPTGAAVGGFGGIGVLAIADDDAR